MTPVEPGDMALYFNGERIPVESFNFGTEDRPLAAYGILSARPVTFTIPIQFTAEDRDKLQKVLDQLSRRTRRQKKGGARYLQSMRRQLVRLAGLAISPERKRVNDTMKTIYRAMGVRIPRSLR